MKKTVLNHKSRRVWLPELFKEKGFKIGVEIGTDRGEYADILLNRIPGLTLVCVDPWVAYTEGNEVKTQEDVDKIYEKAMSRINGRAFIFRTISMEAVKVFADNSLDFVFIDGNHSYNFVKEDIEEWTKKVKKGGIVSGHDYKEDKVNNYGVIEAVDEYCEKNDLELFILRAGGTLVNCWMFYKK